METITICEGKIDDKGYCIKCFARSYSTSGYCDRQIKGKIMISEEDKIEIDIIEKIILNWLKSDNENCTKIALQISEFFKSREFLLKKEDERLTKELFDSNIENMRFRNKIQKLEEDRENRIARKLNLEDEVDRLKKENEIFLRSAAEASQELIKSNLRILELEQKNKELREEIERWEKTASKGKRSDEFGNLY